MDEQEKPDVLYDDLGATPPERFLGWMISLGNVSRVLVGCGIVIVAFILGMLAWGLFFDIIF